MWFKNITLFEFIENVPFNMELLSEKLGDYKFHGCKGSNASSIGWVSPVPGYQDSDSLVHEANGFLMVSLKIQEKLFQHLLLKKC